MNHPVKQSANVWIIMALVLGTLALYWRVTTFEFLTYDDQRYVAANPAVLSGLTLKGLGWAFTTGHMSIWHPVTWISYMIDCELFGRSARMHHLINIAFHVLNTLLLFTLLQRMTGALWRSALVAVLFAWHPLHVESVAWISERKDLLSTCFGLLTIMAYTRYVRAREPSTPTPLPEQPGSRDGVAPRKSFPKSLYYAAALIFFAFGLMSKPMLVTWPFVLLLLDFWPLDRIRIGATGPGTTSIWKLVGEKLPFFVLTIITSVVAYIAQERGGALEGLRSLTLLERLGNAAVSYVRYLGKMIWPVDLCVLYPHPGHWPTAIVIASVATLFFLSTTVLALARRRPWMAMGWFWFVGTLVPVIGIIQQGLHAMADRFTYIPMIGLLIALVWLSAEIVERLRIDHRVASLFAALVLAAFACVSWRQIGYWRNSVLLWGRAVTVTQNNAIAQYNYAYALSLLGNKEQTMQHYREAVRLNPNYFPALINLGSMLYEAGQWNEATNLFSRAVNLQPKSNLANYWLGKTLIALGDFSGAEARFAAACAADESDAESRCRWGETLLALNRTADAAQRFSEALQLNSGLADAHAGMGQVFAAQHNVREAMAYYRIALQLQPKAPQTLNNLAWLLATANDSQFRDGAEAVALAKQACELTGYQQGLLVGTLGAAYAEAGQFDEATASAEKAIELAHASGDEQLVTSSRRLLHSFQLKQPIREAP